MKNLIALIFSSLFTITATAQSYTTAAGLRLGSDIGLSVQQRFTKKHTLEGILETGARSNTTKVTLLYERHHKLLFRGINFYTGFGMHKGWIDEQEYGSNWKDPFGVTGIAGAELSLGRINLSVDYKPVLNLSGGEKAFDAGTAVSVRYVLIKKKKKKLNVKFWEKDKKKKRKR